MDHIAIMKKEWGFVEKILSGEKTIESRWYKNKYKPWDAIERGETIYFKNSGEQVTIKAEIKKVIQFSDLNQKKTREILNEHGKDIGMDKPSFAPLRAELRKGKKYCILIFLKNPKIIKPFEINKKGFGAMASWLTVKNIYDLQSRKTI